MTLTTEMRELLEAPQWDDNQWALALQAQVSEGIHQATMFRPWLGSFATVSELMDEGIVDGKPKMERFLLPEVKGKRVSWLGLGGTIDSTAMTVGVFEPPAQWVSFHGTLGFNELKAGAPGMIAESILLAAGQIDDAFRRRMTALRVLGGDLRVGLWSGLRTKNWIEDNGDSKVWHLEGKYLVAAAVIGEPTDQADPHEEHGPPAAAAMRDQPQPTVEEENAALQEHLEEHAAADDEPKREPYDEPAGDLREVEPDDQSLLDRSEDFSDAAAVGGMGGTRRVQ